MRVWEQCPRVRYKSYDVGNANTTVSSVLNKYAPETFKVGDDSRVSPSIYPSVNNINLHVLLLIYVVLI